MVSMTKSCHAPKKSDEVSQFVTDTVLILNGRNLILIQIFFFVTVVLAIVGTQSLFWFAASFGKTCIQRTELVITNVKAKNDQRRHDEHENDTVVRIPCVRLFK